MEEIEIPTEHLHEAIHEKAEEAHNADKKEKRWSMYIVVSTAFMAVFAAMSGLMAGHHSNEALIEQIKASDNWAFYQAKGIKAEIKSLKNPEDPSIERYKKEQEEIKKDADGEQQLSEYHLQKHIVLARAVTLFQIAIAISAIAILTKKRFLWFISMGLTLVGLVFFITGLI